MSVFIIDDNETTRAILRMIIQGEIYHVIGKANDGISDMARAQKLHPDIVCLDIDMPDSSGLDTLSTSTNVAQCRVLMVVGNNCRGAVVTAIPRGPAGLF